MYGTYNKLQTQYDMMAPNDWEDGNDNGLPTEAEIIAKYREAAIAAMWECNLSNKGYLTEEEIAECALIIATDSGENWI